MANLLNKNDITIQIVSEIIFAIILLEIKEKTPFNTNEEKGA